MIICYGMPESQNYVELWPLVLLLGGIILDTFGV